MASGLGAQLQPDRADVFLSYSSADAQWVCTLKDTLQSRGIRVWMDQNEIRPGDLFAEALNQGIESCSCVLLVISPDAIRSQWVNVSAG